MNQARLNIVLRFSYQSTGSLKSLDRGRRCSREDPVVKADDRDRALILKQLGWTDPEIQPQRFLRFFFFFNYLNFIFYSTASARP